MKQIKKLMIIVGILSIGNMLFAQDKITLQECFESAIVHHPLYAQKMLKSEESALQVEDYKKDLLPQIYMNGKATYQNEVIGLNLQIPGMDIPELSKDQYRLSLDINQAIYRGGIYQKQKDLEAINQVLEQLEVDKNLYYIKKDVKSLFFSIILLDEQKSVLKSYQEQIDTKANELQAMVEEGLVLQTEKDALMAERIQVQQQISDIQIQRKALLTNLELLTKRDLSGIKELVITPVNLEGEEQNRLEYQMMIASQNKLEYSKNLIDAQKLPMISAFATGGYGRPGFNYLSDDFDDFLMVGVNLKWKILNWNKFNNKKKILDLNIQMIETQKKDFETNIQIILNQIQAEIDKIDSRIQSDPELIRLRKNVADNSSNQLNQGVITSSIYIDDLEKLNQAKINMKIHEIQLINTKLDYLNILGKL
jgi:outer membrane protein TolC